VVQWLKRIWFHWTRR